MTELIDHIGDGLRKPSAPIFVQRVTTAAQADIAYRIRHDAYAAAGHIAPRPDRLFADAYDDFSNAYTFIAYVGDTPTASLRVCTRRIGSDDLMPCASTFPEAVAAIERQYPDGTTVMETNRLTRLPDCHDMRVHTALFRLNGQLSVVFGAAINFIAARRNHIPVYRRMGALQVAKPRVYTGLTCEMALCVQLRDRFQGLAFKLPLFAGVAEDTGFRQRILTGDRVPMPMPPSASASWTNLPPEAIDVGRREMEMILAAVDGLAEAA